MPQNESASFEKIDDNFARVTLRYGFMDTPDVPSDLAITIPTNDKPLIEIITSYFVGRNMLRATKDEGLPFWQDVIHIFLQRNAYNPAKFFNIRQITNMCFAPNPNPLDDMNAVSSATASFRRRSPFSERPQSAIYQSGSFQVIKAESSC